MFPPGVEVEAVAAEMLAAVRNALRHVTRSSGL
jgi:hypothetical protein